jgi:Flp pilus assembly CpaF family ATPase
MLEGGREHSEAMRRHLGAGIVAALADDDVTEIYVNAGGGAVWLDRRSVGRVRSAAVLGEGQIRSFLNAVAHAHRVELTRDRPQLQAELPDDELFRQARLQGLCRRWRRRRCSCCASRRRGCGASTSTCGRGS